MDGCPTVKPMKEFFEGGGGELSYKPGPVRHEASREKGIWYVSVRNEGAAGIL